MEFCPPHPTPCPASQSLSHGSDASAPRHLARLRWCVPAPQLPLRKSLAKSSLCLCHPGPLPRGICSWDRRQDGRTEFTVSAPASARAFRTALVPHCSLGGCQPCSPHSCPVLIAFVSRPCSACSPGLSQLSFLWTLGTRRRESGGLHLAEPGEASLGEWRPEREAYHFAWENLSLQGVLQTLLLLQDY